MSGARTIRRKRFFADHPKCCFCGGGADATTEDHIPSRGLFLGRIWPIGYVFPACFQCNNETSHVEVLLAWLVRIRLSEFTPEEEREFERYTLQVSRRFPKIWDGLKLHSRVESRRYLKEMGLPRSLPGVDVVHSMDFPDGVLDIAAGYGVKLGKALHYRHTGRIVPASAVVEAKVYTNANAIGEQFPKEALSVITEKVDIQRSSNSLTGQFDYRFTVVEQGEASAFVIFFAESMVMVVVIFVDAERRNQAQARRAAQEMETIVAASPALPSEP